MTYPGNLLKKVKSQVASQTYWVEITAEGTLAIKQDRIIVWKMQLKHIVRGLGGVTPGKRKQVPHL